MLAKTLKGTIEGMSGKRTLSITVKLNKEDHDTLMRAAETFWPGAIMTNSSIILSLAKLGAEQILKPRKKPQT